MLEGEELVRFGAHLGGRDGEVMSALGRVGGGAVVTFREAVLEGLLEGALDGLADGELLGLKTNYEF